MTASPMHINATTLLIRISLFDPLYHSLALCVTTIFTVISLFHLILTIILLKCKPHELYTQATHSCFFYISM